MKTKSFKISQMYSVFLKACAELVEVKLENHIGAIWNFVHHYNANIAPTLSRQI